MTLACQSSSCPQAGHAFAFADDTAAPSMQTPNGFRAVSPEAPVTPANSSETFPQHSTSAPSPCYLTADACLSTQAIPAVQAALADEPRGEASSSSSASASGLQEQAASEASSHSLGGSADSEPGVNAATAGWTSQLPWLIPHHPLLDL